MSAIRLEHELKRSGGDLLVSALGSYLGLGLSLVITILVTRILGPEAYGQVALFLTLGQTVVFFATFWTTAGLVRFGSEAWLAEGSLARVFWSRNQIAVLPLAAVAIGILGYGRTLLRWLGLPPEGLLVFVGYIAALSIFQTSQFTFQALKRLRAFTMWQVVEKLCLIVGIWVAARWLETRTLLLVALYAGSSAGVGLASLAFLDRTAWLPVQTDEATVRRFMRFSWPLFLSLFCGYLSTNWIDLLVIRYYGSLTSVGHYNLAYQMMGVMQMLPTLSFPVTLPLLVTWQVAGHHEGLHSYTSRLIPHAYVTLAALLVIALAIVSRVIPACFGRGFAAAVEPCGWLLVAVGCYGVFISAMPILNLWEWTRTIFAASAAAGVVNVVGDLALVPRLGISGAAIATTMAYATSAAVVMTAVRRRIHVPLRPLALSLAAVVVAFVGCVRFGSGLSYALGLGVAVGLLGWAVVSEGLFSYTEWQWLRAQYVGDHVAPAGAQT